MDSKVTKRNMGALLSVIVPVYNAEKFISECLDSIIAQGFKEDELQVVCVNDGSTDNSLNILKSYSEKYPFIVCLNKTNGGVSSARNYGLKNADGKYVAFVDADDYILPQSFKQCVDILEKNDALSCSFDFIVVGETEQVTKLVPKVTYHRNNTVAMISSSNVCSRIFRLNLITDNHIHFNEKMSYGEDTLFSYFVSLHLDPSRHIYIHEPIYCYRQDPNSAMHKTSNLRTHQHMTDMLEMAYCYSDVLKNPNLDKIAKNNTKKRMSKAVAAAMYDAMKLKDIDTSKFLDNLRQRELYPYSFLWWTLKPAGSYKNWIMNLLCFFFPISFYYKALVYLVRKLLK